MTTNLPFTWTDEAVHALKQLWADGHSCSQIAARIGHGITRNAVIGKVTRLKLGKRSTVVRSKSQKASSGRAFVAAHRKPNGKGQPKANAIVHRRVYAPPFETAPLPEEELGNDVGHLIGIMDLTKETCRWPHGDPLLPGFGFCGAKVQADSPYCPGHTKRGTRRP